MLKAKIHKSKNSSTSLASLPFDSKNTPVRPGKKETAPKAVFAPNQYEIRDKSNQLLNGIIPKELKHNLSCANIKLLLPIAGPVVFESEVIIAV